MKPWGSCCLKTEMAEDREGKKPKIQVELFFWHPGKCLAGEPGIFSSWMEIPFVVAGIVSGTRSGMCPLFFLFKSIIPLFQVLDWRRSCPAVGSSRIWGKRAWIAQRGEGGRAGSGWQGGGGAGAGGRRGWELLKSVAAEGVVAGIPWGRLEFHGEGSHSCFLLSFQTPILLTPSPLLSSIHFWSTLSPVAPLSPARLQGANTLFQVSPRVLSPGISSLFPSRPAGISLSQKSAVGIKWELLFSTPMFDFESVNFSVCPVLFKGIVNVGVSGMF